MDGRRYRVVRQQAAEFGARPERIGMIGYSAGGAVLLAAVTSPADSRPNFAAPIYAAPILPNLQKTEHRHCLSRWLRTIRQLAGKARWISTRRGARRTSQSNCTSSRPVGTDSRRRVAALTIISTAWKSGSESTAGCQSPRCERTIQLRACNEFLNPDRRPISGFWRVFPLCGSPQPEPLSACWFSSQ